MAKAIKEDDQNAKRIPGHRQLILSGLSRIIATSLLLPLDVISVRLLYPDAWYVSMFRKMVNCKGCGGPYTILTADMLQRRSFGSIRWGHYYCRYQAHQKSCKEKKLPPLSNNLYLLTRRPIIMNVDQIGTFAQRRNYEAEKKNAQMHTLLATLTKGLRSHIYDYIAAGMVNASNRWPFDAMTTSANRALESSDAGSSYWINVNQP